MGPLQAYALPHLSASATAALRSACWAFRGLVDTAPAWALQPAACQLVPLKLLQQAVSGMAVQSMLRHECAILADLRSSNAAVQKQRVTTHPQGKALELQWSPDWPSQSLVILMSSPEAMGEGTQWQETMLQASSQRMLIFNATSRQQSARLERFCLSASQSGWCSRSHLFACLWSSQHRQLLRVIDIAAMSWPQHVAGTDGMDQWISLHPSNEAMLCIARDTRTDVVAHMLPSLAENFRVRPIDLASSDLKPRWAQWSPAGGNSDAFAIAWDIGRQPAALSFHATATGRLITQSDLISHLDLTETSSQPTFTWSPNGGHILVTHNLRASSSSPFQAAIISLSGASHVFKPQQDGQEALLGWSACGRYVHLVEQCEDITQQDVSMAGLIWDAAKNQLLFDWRDEGGSFANNQVVWAAPSSRSACFVESCQVILLLPDSGKPECLAYDGPAKPAMAGTDPATFCFSPCGSLLVGTWRMRDRYWVAYLIASPVNCFPCCRVLASCGGCSGPRRNIRLACTSKLALPKHHCSDLTRCTQTLLHPSSCVGGAACMNCLPCMRCRDGSFSIYPQGTEEVYHQDAWDVKHPCRVWHAEVRAGARTCLSQAIASSQVAWCMGSIAWHPSQAGRIYAIAQVDGTVNLMDGRSHRCLRAWSWAELSQQQAPFTAPQIDLTWSPDGSQLAVAATGVTAILSFASSLLQAPNLAHD